MKINISKIILIKVYRAGFLNDYGKDKLIDKFLKLEDKRKEETRKKISKTMKKKHKR